SQVKAHATTKRCISSDEMYTDVAKLLFSLNGAHSWLHSKYDAKKYPQMLYCSWYQDGMSHALERILRLRSTGIYSDLHQTQHSARLYASYAQRYRKLKYYGDSSYCSGYSNAFVYASLANDERRKHTPPLFFYFDNEIQSAHQYSRSIKNLPDQHK